MNPLKNVKRPDTLLIHCECANVDCRRPVTVPTAAFVVLEPLVYVCHPECAGNAGDKLVEKREGYNVWREVL